MSKNNIAILGASVKPERYSYKAIYKLLEHNYNVYPIAPNIQKIENIKVYKDIDELIEHNIKIHTLTLYVNPNLLEQMKTSIINLRPSRIIFNPGTESKPIMKEFLSKGIECEEACTLVMLSTGQF